MDAEVERGEAMRIARVSEILGVPVPTIRSWERRYDLPAPSRTPGSHRRYTREDVERLRALRDLVTSGYPTRDAVALVRSGAATGSRPADAVGRVVEGAMRLDPAAVRGELDTAAERVGVEEAIRTILLPAMHEVGAAWAVGACDVAGEHLATEAVRQWLGRQAALAPAPFRPRPVVLACGPDDVHTIGLEAFATVLARRGWSCRVLGARTPTDSLVSAVLVLGACAAVVTAQRAVGRRSAAAAIGRVSELGGIRAFYAGAAFAAPAGRRDLRGSYLGEDVLDAVDVFERRIA